MISPQSAVLCAYPYDGGAMNYAWGCGPSMCSAPDNINGCAFPPTMLAQAMEMHEQGQQWPYNEIVVNQSQMAIEAVWGGEGAREMHERLLLHFGVNGNQLPFLGYRNPFG